MTLALQTLMSWRERGLSTYSAFCLILFVSPSDGGVALCMLSLFILGSLPRKGTIFVYFCSVLPRKWLVVVVVLNR